MEMKSFQNKSLGFFKKYRYVILVAAIGIVLMMIPGKNESKKSETLSLPENTSEETVDDSLSAILSEVKGAGKVKVLLTTLEGEEIIYQTNEDRTSGTNENNTSRTDTVTLADAERNQTGLVRQINPPVYQGAIVVCEGANDPAVALAIVDAVSKVTGLGSNRISVLKMK